MLQFNVLWVFIHQVCRYDFVEVKDKDDKVLGKFCGGKIPHTVTSTSNLMWVEFRSDHTQSRGGFSAVYYAGNRANTYFILCYCENLKFYPATDKVLFDGQNLLHGERASGNLYKQ